MTTTSQLTPLDAPAGRPPQPQKSRKSRKRSQTHHGPHEVVLVDLEGREHVVPRDGLVVSDGPRAPGRYVAPDQPPQPAPGTPKPPPHFVVAVVSSRRKRP